MENIAVGRPRFRFKNCLANSNASKPDAQQVYEILLKMLDRWNAHDIEGHRRCTGNLPNYWLSLILNSLTAGSNCLIPT